MTDTYELPPLPELPDGDIDAPTTTDGEGYSGQAMHAYAMAYGQECARLAVKAERERAGKLCEAIANGWISGKEFGLSGPEVAHMIAAAIRKG